MNIQVSYQRYLYQVIWINPTIILWAKISEDILMHAVITLPVDMEGTEQKYVNNIEHAKINLSMLR